MTQIPTNIAYVCADFHNVAQMHEFNNIQDAIDWVPDYGKAKIILYSDFLGIDLLRMRADRTNITIDGLNQYGITFNDDIVKIDERQFLRFRNMTYIRGGQVTLDQEGANFGLCSIQSAVMNIYCQRGRYSNVYIYNTKLYGDDNRCAFDIDNPDCGIEVMSSILKGGYKNPAIMFNTDSDRQLRIKHSTIMCGGPDVFAPIQSSGDYNIGVRIHNCSSNSRICNRDIDNHIVNNNNNIGDTEIIF